MNRPSKPTKGREYLLRTLDNLKIRKDSLYDNNQELEEGISTTEALVRLQSQLSAAGGVNERITNLENKYLYYEVYELVTTDTGTITKAQGAEILLDRYEDAGDAIVVKVDTNNRPIDEAVKTDLEEVVIVTSFDINGDYVLSGIPSEYPVALVYQIRIQIKDSGNVIEESILNLYKYPLTSKDISHRMYTVEDRIDNITESSIIRDENNNITSITTFGEATIINRDVDGVITGWENDTHEWTLIKTGDTITGWTVAEKE